MGKRPHYVYDPIILKLINDMKKLQIRIQKIVYHCYPNDLIISVGEPRYESKTELYVPLTRIMGNRGSFTRYLTLNRIQSDNMSYLFDKVMGMSTGHWKLT